MATRAILTALSAEFPSSAFPQLLTVNARPVLAFDAAAAEQCQWVFVAPQGLLTPVNAVLSYTMVSATTGNVRLEAYLEAVASAAARNIHTTDFFSAANALTDAVPGTAGHMKQASITLTNNDSIAAGTLVRLRVRRDAAHADDTAAGDLYLHAVEFRDAA